MIAQFRFLIVRASSDFVFLNLKPILGLYANANSQVKQYTRLENEHIFQSPPRNLCNCKGFKSSNQ